MDLPIQYDHEKLKAFCEKWQIAEQSFFGSVLRADFKPDSDIDVMVLFKACSKFTILWDHTNMAEELEAILGRKADLASKNGIMESRNHFYKSDILNSAKVIYAAARSGQILEPSA